MVLWFVWTEVITHSLLSCYEYVEICLWAPEDPPYPTTCLGGMPTGWRDPLGNLWHLHELILQPAELWAAFAKGAQRCSLKQAWHGVAARLEKHCSHSQASTWRWSGKGIKICLSALCLKDSINSLRMSLSSEVASFTNSKKVTWSPGFVSVGSFWATSLMELWTVIRGIVLWFLAFL